MRKDDIAADVPIVRAAEYLVGYLFEIGPTMPGGMGDVSLTHGELRAWMMNVGIGLSPWESRTLRRLSRDYLVEAQRATEPSRPAPYVAASPISPERRAAVAKKLESYFG